MSASLSRWYCRRDAESAVPPATTTCCRRDVWHGYSELNVSYEPYIHSLLYAGRRGVWLRLYSAVIRIKGTGCLKPVTIRPPPLYFTYSINLLGEFEPAYKCSELRVKYSKAGLFRKSLNFTGLIKDVLEYYQVC